MFADTENNVKIVRRQCLEIGVMLPQHFSKNQRNVRTVPATIGGSFEKEETLPVL